jgi:diacylglycerol kinase family enzyme
MQKGLLIHNPKARSLDGLLPKLGSVLGEVVPVDIEGLGEAGDPLQYAEANHCDWIAVAGGDGTVESVASSLVGTTFPLGIIPVGTYNNFARSLPLDPIEACHVILGRSPVSAWRGDQVGSGRQVVRFDAPSLPLSTPEIRARARPASL